MQAPPTVCRRPDRPAQYKSYRPGQALLEQTETLHPLLLNLALAATVLRRCHCLLRQTAAARQRLKAGLTGGTGQGVLADTACPADLNLALGLVEPRNDKVGSKVAEGPSTLSSQALPDVKGHPSSNFHR